MSDGNLHLKDIIYTCSVPTCTFYNTGIKRVTTLSPKWSFEKGRVRAVKKKAAPNVIFFITNHDPARF